jgi:hypothetical protein
MSLYAALQANRSNISDIFNEYEILKNEYISTNNREPTTEENRQLFILSYVEAKLKDFSENGVIYSESEENEDFRPRN